MSVSALVMEFGGDEDQAIAGLLHDALEDCGLEHEKVISANWGERVAQIVRDCTDGVPDSEGKKLEWHTRKQRYLEHLGQVSSDSLLVSACDKLHNARTIVADLCSGHDVFARFKAGRSGTVWYYKSLLETFAERFPGTSPILSELARSIGAMEQLATAPV